MCSAAPPAATTLVRQVQLCCVDGRACLPSWLALWRPAHPTFRRRPAAMQEGSAACAPCAPGTFAYSWGSSYCKACIEGTHAPAGACTAAPGWLGAYGGVAFAARAQALP